LTVAAKLVRGLSGLRPISVHSEILKGTKFTFYVKNKAKNAVGVRYKGFKVFGMKFERVVDL
jgi:hypothetical protein